MKREMGKREGENREGEARTGLPIIQKNTKTHTQIQNTTKRIHCIIFVFFCILGVFLCILAKNTQEYTKNTPRIQKNTKRIQCILFVFFCILGRPVRASLSLVLQSCFVLFSLASLSSLVSAFVRLGLCASGFLGICACRPLGVWPLASGPLASGPLASGPLGLY